MTVSHIEFLVEDPSTEAALSILLPEILSDGITFSIHSSQSKQELLGNLEKRLRGYSRWLPPEWLVVVVFDRDDHSCETLKDRVNEIASAAGLQPKSAESKRFRLAARLAIEELEAWFFGDWNAVSEAYPGVDKNLPSKRQYRDPDGIAGGTWEALERALKRAGHCPSGYRKIEGARKIASRMDPAINTSRSFQSFRTFLSCLQPPSEEPSPQ